MSAPLLGWYGDDFTGATDTLAVLAQAGRRAMLFLGVPGQARLAQAAHTLGGALHAVGIAGASRAMPPDAMAAELEPVGAFFERLLVPVLHYKVCSTFDSAPGVGSIGAAVRTLRTSVSNRFVPIVGGQPSLGRYCAFSNLFAAAGRGGTVERIDRHPTMRSHPVTPMQEADLRRHLALQGLASVAAVHYPLYRESAQAQDDALSRVLAGDAEAVLLDVADEAHLACVGRLLWRRARQAPLLAVGSSGVAQALIAHWVEEGLCAGPAGATDAALPAASTPVLVFAGSLSPVTARQVRAATSFVHVPVPAGELLGGTRAEGAAQAIRAALGSGRHVLAYTAGTNDPLASAPPGELAAASGAFLRGVLQEQALGGPPWRRLGIAGGDTSSLCVQAMGLWGLSYCGALGPGVTVSRTHAQDPAFDGIELMLKGGQMGAEDVFEQLA